MGFFFVGDGGRRGSSAGAPAGVCGAAGREPGEAALRGRFPPPSCPVPPGQSRVGKGGKSREGFLGVK